MGLTGSLIDSGLIEMTNFLSPLCTAIVTVSLLAAAVFALKGMMEYFTKSIMAAFGGALALGAVGISYIVLNAGVAVANASVAVFDFLTGGVF